MELDCTYIVPPMVVESRLIDMASFGNWRGVYIKGEPYIFISPGLPSWDMPSTEFHETIHYLYPYTGRDQDDRCANEALARKLTSLEFNKPYSESWRQNYDCEE